MQIFQTLNLIVTLKLKLWRKKNREESLKEQLFCNKCNSAMMKTGEQFLKCSSCLSIQLAVPCYKNLVIKFACNAKFYSCLTEVLANVVLADVEIGNNEEFTFVYAFQ